MDSDGLDFIISEVRDALNKLVNAQDMVSKYTLNDGFLTNWTDTHNDHLSALTTFANNLGGLIVSQGQAKILKGKSRVEKGKERSTQELQKRKTQDKKATK